MAKGHTVARTSPGRKRRRYKKRPPSQGHDEAQEHAVLRLSLGRENGWTNSISTAPSNPRYHQHSNDVTATTASQSNSQSETAGVISPRQSLATTNTSSVNRYAGERSPRSVGVSNASRQVFLWVFRDPNHIHSISIDRSNPTTQLKDHVERIFDVESDSYTLASLVPGVAYPIPIMKFASDINKGFVICLPTKSFIVHVTGTNNDESFSVKVNPLQTVRELKQQIQQVKGYPIAVQDLQYEKQTLQNKHLVIDYRISSACHLQLFLQPSQSYAVYVEAFWGKTYTIEVNACSTSDELLNKVFRKTLAKPAYREQIFKTRTMYQGLVLVEYDGVILDRKYCLNYYGIGKNSTLHILSTSQARRDQRTVVDVVQDTGTKLQVRSAPFDTWLVVALHLHGMTTLYLDMMTILVDDKPVDFQKCISTSLQQNPDYIQTTLVMLPPPSGMMHKLIVHVVTSSGGIETVHCGPRETIKDIKRRLEIAGVDYAAYHDILYKKVRLPSNTRLYEYKLSAMERCMMDMKLNEFPVCVQHGDLTVKMAAHHESAVSVLVRKIEDKLLVSPIKHCIIHAGEDLYTCDALALNETYLFINSHLYIEPISSIRSLYLVANDNTKVPLPSKPTLDNLHIQQLSDVCRDPETFTESLKWFLRWRYPMKSTIFNSRHAPADANVGYARKHSSNASKGLHLGVAHIGAKSTANGAATSSASHNHLHDRVTCRPSSRHRRYAPILLNSKVADNLRNAVSDEEVYAAHHGRQIALLPNIAHTNKTTEQQTNGIGTGIAKSGSPQPQKSSIKSAKSSDNIFECNSREAFDAYSGSGGDSNAPPAKKKLSVRFEIPEGQEPPHREHKQRHAWQQFASNGSSGGSGGTGSAGRARQQPINAEDLMVHYQRLRLRSSALRRSNSDRAPTRGTAARITGSNQPSVAVKFSMNV